MSKTYYCIAQFEIALFSYQKLVGVREFNTLYDGHAKEGCPMESIMSEFSFQLVRRTNNNIRLFFGSTTE